MPSFSQNEFPELQESNLLHLDAAVGFDSPEKIRAAPGRKPVTAGRVPEEAEHVEHLEQIITTKGRKVHKGKGQQPKTNDQKPNLQIVLFHQMSERAVGNFQQIGCASLDSVGLRQRILQQ